MLYLPSVNTPTIEPIITDYADGLLPSLRAFLHTSFPQSPLKSDPKYLRWRSVENPFTSAQSAWLVAVRENQVCAQLSVSPDRIYVQGSWREGVWLYDLFVAEENRGSLLALQLVQRTMKRNEIVLVTGSAAHLKRFYTALKWKHLEICQTLFWIRRPSRLLLMASDTGEQSSRLRMASVVLKPADPIWAKVMEVRVKIAKRSGDSIDISEATSAPEDLEEIVSAHCEAGTITTARDPEYLKWKFEGRPVGKHILLSARQAGDRKLLGYLALKLMKRSGGATWTEVVDYLVYPEDTVAFPALLQHAQRLAIALNLDFMRCRCSLPAHIKSLAAAGWVNRTRPIIDDVFVYAKRPEIREALQNAPWHLTAIVSDRSDYGKDEWADPS